MSTPVTWRRRKKGQSDVEFLVEAIDMLSANTAKWLADIAAHLREQRHLERKEAKVKIMYIVKDDNSDVGYAIAVSEVKDAEGNVIPDAQVSVDVVSDNPDVVAVTPGADSKAGTIHFGAPGNANITANVKDGSGNILGSGVAGFLVTTGDPASIASVSLAFEGLSEAPAVPPA